MTQNRIVTLAQCFQRLEQCQHPTKDFLREVLQRWLDLCMHDAGVQYLDALKALAANLQYESIRRFEVEYLERGLLLEILHQRNVSASAYRSAQNQILPTRAEMSARCGHGVLVHPLGLVPCRSTEHGKPLMYRGIILNPGSDGEHFAFLRPDNVPLSVPGFYPPLTLR